MIGCMMKYDEGWPGQEVKRHRYTSVNTHRDTPVVVGCTGVPPGKPAVLVDVSTEPQTTRDAVHYGDRFFTTILSTIL